MTFVKVSVKPRSAALLAAATRGRAQRVVDKEAVILGESMVREVQRIVGEEFKSGSPDHRKPGPHLRESFTYEVHRTQRGSSVKLTIKRGVSAKKVAALEYGAKSDYEITPSGLGNVSGKRQRAALAGLRIAPITLLRFPDPVTGEDQYAPKVIHKAFEGKHMMRRARAAAVAKRRRT